METAIIYSCISWGLHRDNGKEHGNCYNIFVYILGLHRDKGKENGNFYNIYVCILGYIGIMEKKLETAII